LDNSNVLKNKLNAIKNKYELEGSDQEALDELIKNLSYQPSHDSHTLDEQHNDLIKLSKALSNTERAKVKKIYQQLYSNGYYFDEKIILALDSTDLLLKAMIHKKITNPAFVQQTFEKDELIEISLHDHPKEKMIDLLLQRENPWQSLFNISFDILLTDAENKPIYIAKKHQGDYDNHSTEQLLKAFNQYIIEQGLSHNTVINYLRDIKLFLNWLTKKDILINNLSRQVIMEYYEKLYENYAIKSIQKIVSSLSKFNEFLMEKNYLNKKLIFRSKDVIKDLVNHEVEVFNSKEQYQILNALKQNILSPRAQVIVQLLYYTGIRASEAKNIKLKDINFKTAELIVIGKGRKRRKVPMRDELCRAIQHYIKGPREKSKLCANSDYLLISQRAKTIARDTVRKDIKPLENIINSKVYPHKFRHTFATNLVKKGVEISTVARLLGHSDIQTTISYYVNTSKKDKIKAIEKL
jgi:integrase/recombinase XerD